MDIYTFLITRATRLAYPGLLNSISLRSRIRIMKLFILLFIQPYLSIFPFESVFSICKSSFKILSSYFSHF